jgi:primosomal protein N' (replication factor Y)
MSLATSSASLPREQSASLTALLARVVVLAPMAEALDYLVPDGLDLSPGDHVVVPLGHARVRGLVIGFERSDAVTARFNLKTVVQKLDDPPVPEASLNFWLWAANWTLTPPGILLNGCLRALKGARAQVKHGYVLTEQPLPENRKIRKTKARERVLDSALVPMGLSELAMAAGVSTGVVSALEKEGLLTKIAMRSTEAWPKPDPDFAPAHLNDDQFAAHQLLRNELNKGEFAPVLLDGVTGSGKTEVYLEAVADALRGDLSAQVLVLLPEIALTQAVMERLEKRFGVPVAQWHANISNASRRKIWEGVAAGKVRLIVGARSALFLPYQRLGLVIVDEEHDSAYKQEEGARYQARDLAVARARMDGAMVVLASATPSLETLTNAQKGRYAWIRLEQRHGTAQLPDITLIDMKAHSPDKGMWLSDLLVGEILATLRRREQVMLFLNRRGYAPLVLCKACGEKMMSPNTDSWLVEHRSSGRLICHLTGFSMRKPAACPHCGAKDSLISVGPGVERILEEVQSRFPDARAEVFSSDTVPDAAASASLIKRIEDHDIDIVIATQAAAKGHNFPNLTLVGIVDADLGLKGGDLRAAERTFQLLQQATGRAGRKVKPGRALVQTYTPEHPVMQALARGDREAFYAYESMSREAASFPPFGRLAAVILSAKDQALLNRFSRELALFIPNAEGVDVYGPADAPLSLVRGQWRKRFLVRADRNRDLQAFVTHWLAAIRRPNAIRLVVDIDPYSFL